ncbi:ribbon-helix-helix domain-containing protein [Microvirga sesbaniae]|uniref:ribbon-helix-helix domain-containing protein n=1 Tax=Microvirga sesbaniae TaxID=681392 RepID=UPI0021C666DD|nr:ribbon-helix-helix domain-containing protein [Microvirga sp. HBU67692]
MANKPDMRAKLAANRASATETPATLPDEQPRRLTPAAAKEGDALPFLNTRQPELARTNLRIIAAKTGKSMEYLILEALNALYAQHGLPEVHQPEGRRK